MKWITDFLHLPMTWDVIIPVILLMFFAMFLVWESRLPPGKKIFRKLWKQRTPAIVKKMHLSKNMIKQLNDEEGEEGIK